MTKELDPMRIYRVIVEAARPQLANSVEGRYMAAVLGDAGMDRLRTLIDKIARNSANSIACEIETPEEP